MACCVDGGAALDVYLHFAQRWEHHRRELKKKVPALLPYTDTPRNGLGPGAELIDATGPIASSARVVRSAGGWSLGVPTDSSAAKAWSDVISSSKHFVYIEQQYFITSFDEESDSDEELDFKGASVLNGNPIWMSKFLENSLN